MHPLAGSGLQISFLIGIFQEDAIPAHSPESHDENVPNRSSSIQVARPGGPRLHLLDWEGENSVCCVLIHGLGDGSYVWDDFAPRVAQYCRTVAVDLRGHGWSEWDLEGRYDIASHTDDVAYILSSLRSRRFLLVGHSLGGEIAIRVARLLPDRICGLVVADFSIDANAEAINQVYEDIRKSARQYTSISEYVEWFSTKRPLAQPLMLEHLAKNSLKINSTGSFELRRDPAIAKRTAYDTSSRRAFLSTILGQLSCPTLILRGVGSAVLSRRISEEMAGLVQNAKKDTIAAAGHAVMTDNPVGFAAVTLPFLLQLLEKETSGTTRNQRP